MKTPAFLVLLLTLLWLPAMSPAQDAAAISRGWSTASKEDADKTLAVNLRLANEPHVVEARAAAEDGAELPVAWRPFSTLPGASTTWLIILDTSDPRRADTIAAGVEHIREFIESLAEEGENKVAVFSLARDLRVELDMTPAAEARQAPLDGLAAEGDDALTTLIYLNVRRGIEQHLTSTPPAENERRAVLLLTDGKDESPTPEDGAMERRRLINLASISGIPIHTIAYAERADDQRWFGHLREISEDTGGLHLPAALRTRALPPVYAGLAGIARSGGVAEIDLQSLAEPADITLHLRTSREFVDSPQVELPIPEERVAAAFDTASADAPEDTPTLPAPSITLLTEADDAKPRIEGTAPTDSRVSILLNGSEVATTVADDEGKWTHEWEESLSPGTWEITARIVDDEGDFGATSDAVEVTLAAALQIHPPDAEATATPVIRGSAPPRSRIVVSADGVEIGTAQANDEGAWSLDPAALGNPLTPGTREITARIVDDEGRETATAGPVAVQVVAPESGAMLWIALVLLLLILGVALALYLRGKRKAEQQAIEAEARRLEQQRAREEAEAEAEQKRKLAEAEAEAQQMEEAPPAPLAWLEECSTEQTRHPITSSSVKIGRGRHNDLVFRNDSVSGNHCVLQLDRSGQWMVTDLGSGNGVMLNGEAIQQASLQHGDTIELGEVKLRLILGS